MSASSAPPPGTDAAGAPMHLVLITGMSGSGKSVALHALEDAGYYCVDNLPPELLHDLITLEQHMNARRVAIAIDVRSRVSLPQVPLQLAQLREAGMQVQSLFLDSTTETLVHRFSETRRRHPLSRDDSLLDTRRDLVDAIEHERELLAELRERALVIDTSLIRSAQLQGYVKALAAAPRGQLTLVFESFAFKRGIPVDADYVFDVRMLPNPHYEPALKPLTGCDAPVADFLRSSPDVQKMQSAIEQFLSQWIAKLADNHRSYITVAIGCTGGQHRSVYLVEQLAAHYSTGWATLKRHRELDSR